MTQYVCPICYGCTRFRDVPAGQDRLCCTAYPAGIPEAILFSQADHRQPYAGDGGQQFDPADAAGAAYAETVFNPEPVNVDAPP
jgi:hypothetical protein